MIDTVNLIFRQDLSDIAVQQARRIQVPPKRLLDDDPPPVSVGLFRQAGRAELLDDLSKQVRWRSQVIEVIAPRAMFLFNLGQQRLESLISCRIVEVTGKVIQPCQQPVAKGAVVGSAAELFQVVPDAVPEFILAERPRGATDEREILRQQISLGEVVKGGEQFALGQVPGRAENDHGARVPGPAMLFVGL